jgi:hypothetical protein
MLSEAPEDENQAGDEPMEQDADMSNDGGDQQDGNNEDDGDMDGMDMGDGGDGENGDGGESSDGGMGGAESYDTGDNSVDPKEAPKKKVLFNNFKKILSISDDIINSISYINSNEMSPDTKKIFNYMEKKITENHKKIVSIMTSQFTVMSYRQLMTLYLYCKMTVQSYVEIVNDYIANPEDK